MIISKFPPPTSGEKADGFIKLSTSYLDLPMTVGETESFTFVSLGAGEVTATSSDTGICTASISGNTVTLTVTGNGLADITVSVAESSTNKAAEAVCTCVNVDPVLANNSPAMIKNMADIGTASSVWNIGDRTAPISIAAFGTISAVNTICAFILGFDHNQAIEGTGIHFQLGKLTNGTDVCIVDSSYGSSSSSSYCAPNSSDSNSKAWSGCTMHTRTMPAFYSALPAEWQNVIVACAKYTCNTKGTAESYVTALTENTWLLAEYEVFGARTYANEYEKNKQIQYDYYKNGNSKIKYKYNSTSTAAYWMTRSINVSSSYSWASVGTGGTVYNDNYGNKSQGFAPAFKVGGVAA